MRFVLRAACSCAQGYHNEELVGEALRLSGVAREELFIATKLSDPEAMRSEPATLRSVEFQLRTLAEWGATASASGSAVSGSYLDLYYVHMDFFTDQLGEDAERRVWHTLERLHKAGRLRALGVCNYSVQALERLWKLARIKPTVLQCKFDPLHPGYQRLGSQPHEQADVVGWAQAHGMAVVAYSTLSGWPFALRAVEDPHVAAIAKTCGQSTASVLLRHAMQHGLAVIPSSSNPERLKTNRAALGFELDAAQMQQLDGLAHLLSPVPSAPRFRADVYGGIPAGKALPASPTSLVTAAPAPVTRPPSSPSLFHPNPPPSPYRPKPPTQVKPSAVSISGNGYPPASDAAPSKDRPYPSYLVGGTVERRQWDDPEVSSLMRRGVPLVLSGGCPLVAGLIDRWSFEYLADGAGPFSAHPVHTAPWGESRSDSLQGAAA